jgi:TRAP transporter TAXI family solute receptor
VDRLRAFLSSTRVALVLGLVALAAAALLLFLPRGGRHALRISAGDLLGRRAAIARALAAEAGARGLSLDLVEAPGSLEVLERIQRREIDLGLVQGGLEVGADVREVTALALEPLHLLVRPESELYDIGDLEGRTVQLSPPGSGTRALALSVLGMVGLTPEDGFTEVSHTQAELAEMSPEELPDAVFTVSSLPSSTATFLIEERGFQLVALPFAEAMAVENLAIHVGAIPAYTYGVDPPMPRQDLPTLATRMIVVAHRDAPAEAIRTLLASLHSERFLRAANLRPPDDSLLEQPELPLHPGTVAWLHRNDPVLTSDGIQGLESLRSFLVSLVIAAILLYRWYQQRSRHGLDAYFGEVTQIDAEALEAERSPTLDLSRLLALRARLGDAKRRALAAFAAGKVHSDELLSSFLTHVTDVRSHLNSMILHERERIEKKARSRGAEESEALREMWQDALDDDHDDHDDRAAASAAPARAEPAASGGEPSAAPRGKKK